MAAQQPVPFGSNLNLKTPLKMGNSERMTGAQTRRAITSAALLSLAMGALFATGAISMGLKALGLSASIDDLRRLAYAQAQTMDWNDLVSPGEIASQPLTRNGTAPRGIVRHGELGATTGPAQPDDENLPMIARTLGGYRDLSAPPRNLVDSLGGLGNMRALQPLGGETRPELEGRTIRISGFMTPLTFERGRITAFLLTPYTGACIHVPPPRANQIIHVSDLGDFRADQGLLFPLRITGVLRLATLDTDLARVGYAISGGLIERLN